MRAPFKFGASILGVLRLGAEFERSLVEIRLEGLEALFEAVNGFFVGFGVRFPLRALQLGLHMCFQEN